MQILTCTHCSVRVALKVDGSCPSCGEPVDTKVAQEPEDRPDSVEDSLSVSSPSAFLTFSEDVPDNTRVLRRTLLRSVQSLWLWCPAAAIMTFVWFPIGVILLIGGILETRAASRALGKTKHFEYAERWSLQKKVSTAYCAVIVVGVLQTARVIVWFWLAQH
jgi:hypothetical protein